MNEKEMMSHVDHTQLKAYAVWEDIRKLCEEAVAFQTASVCVPPVYVKRIRESYGDRLKICTVIGFPLGYHTAAVKAAETKQAVADGADEIDMVIHVGAVKDGDWEAVKEEIMQVREASRGHILKVIIETCYLNEEEKAAMCRIVTECGADYIKTSTGFGTAGATMEDVTLFQKHIGSGVKIKAAGGISDLEDVKAFIEAGCDRIGTSKAVGLCQGKKTEGY